MCNNLCSQTSFSYITVLFSTTFNFPHGASLLRVHCSVKDVCKLPRGISLKKKKIQGNITLWSFQVWIFYSLTKCYWKAWNSNIAYTPLFLLDKPCVNTAYPCLTNFPAVWHALSSGDLSWYSVYVRHCCNSHGVKWLQRNTQINIVNYWTL